MISDTPMLAEQAVASLSLELEHLLRDLHSPLVDDFLQVWPPNTRAARVVTPSSVPVLRWLTDLPGDIAPVAARFVTQLAAVSADLAWQRSYDGSAASGAFMEHYGYCEILGSSAAIASSHLAAGVLLLGPHTEYPAHWHEAEELYVPLAGAARWWQGVQSWRIRQPGEVIHHARHEPHAMRTAGTPLLALYLWRSENLGQKSQLISASLR